MRSITYSIFINAPAEKIWAALTLPEYTRQYWTGFAIRSEWKAGAPVSMIKPDGRPNWEGTIRECEPHSLLSYTFDPSVDPNYTGENVSRITWKIEPFMGTMMLTLIHEEISDKFEEGARLGWPYFISSIKSLLETGKALPPPHA